MKAFSLIAALSICFQGLIAQPGSDTIFPVVSVNQVSIHQDNAYHNCSFTPGLEHIIINDRIINWYQVDTIGMISYCMCFFDYSVTIDSLSPGTYVVYVYSAYNSADLTDTTYQGSSFFTIEGQTQCDSFINLTSFVGACHEYTAIKNIPSNRERYILENHSNEVSIISNGPEKIILVVLSDLSGQEVVRKVYNSASEIQIPTTTFKKGIYIISLYDNHNAKVNSKLIVI